MKVLYKVSYAAAATVCATLVLTAGGCDNNSAPSADSDSQQKYKDGSAIPVDDNYYEIKGEVVGQVNDLTRQVKPAQGSIGGYNYNGYGSMSGTYTGPIEAGKGFVRLKIDSTSPSAPEATVGEAVILKTSDTKVTALQPGDIITFKCRRQYEAVAAVRENSDFDKNKAGTWEFDYCRMETPKLEVK
jgi:hypothetical protein